MVSLLALALAVAQSGETALGLSCPAITLAASPARAATLVANDLTAGYGPVITLELPASEAEVRSFGTLSLIRLSGKPLSGGLLRRRIGVEGEGFSFELPFEPEQLAAVAAATKLELVASDGAVIAIALTPADPAPIKACLDANGVPAAPPGDPLTRRSFTFVPLEPNQPLRLRYRGDPGPMYPSMALREERQGASRVALTIGKSGRVTECAVVISSGHEDLDAASCRAARISAYLPETDAQGEPVETKRQQNLNWVIPK